MNIVGPTPIKFRIPYPALPLLAFQLDGIKLASSLIRIVSAGQVLAAFELGQRFLGFKTLVPSFHN